MNVRDLKEILANVHDDARVYLLDTISGGYRSGDVDTATRPLVFAEATGGIVVLASQPVELKSENVLRFKVLPGG
jgi:hypothetical protein